MESSDLCAELVQIHDDPAHPEIRNVPDDWLATGAMWFVKKGYWNKEMEVIVKPPQALVSLIHKIVTRLNESRVKDPEEAYKICKKILKDTRSEY